MEVPRRGSDRPSTGSLRPVGSLGSPDLAALAAVSIDRRRPVGPQVYEILREAIVSVDLRPGLALSEVEVAAQIGVSRTPVREAFIRLATEGLVGIIPQLGTLVTLIDVNEVVEAQFVREVLEVAAARHACARITAREADALATNLRLQSEASDSSDLHRFHDLDDALHRLIFEIGGHRSAWDVVHGAKPQLDRVRHLSLPDLAVRRQDIAEHLEIAEAITSGRPADVEAAVQRHARNILGVVPRLREQRPTFFISED